MQLSQPLLENGIVGHYTVVSEYRVLLKDSLGVLDVTGFSEKHFNVDGFISKQNV
jgi:hypothetical protein